MLSAADSAFFGTRFSPLHILINRTRFLILLKSWNDQYWPLIVLNSHEMRALPAGLSSLQHEGYALPVLSMAPAAPATLPVPMLIVLFQLPISEGVLVTEMTGC